MHTPRLSLVVLLLVSFGCGPLATVEDGGQGDAHDVAANDAGTVGDAGDDDAGAPSDAGSDAGYVPVIQSGTTIEVEQGTVVGVEEGGLRVFRGIPYAEPPVGNDRFRAPVKKDAWSIDLDASSFGPACPQQDLGGLVLGDVALSEDCLSLNIWAHDDGTLRPVMVFIHGGAFIMGGSSQPLYDGARLAQEANVTVVSLNYRLGALGWLASEAIAIEDGAPGAGNYGLMDQLLALRFVKDNIRAFGGDDENITIFGESAGAISVCAILGVPEADSLYDKAIVESGMCALSTYDAGGLIGMPNARELAESVVDEVGCGDAAFVADCLRAKPVDDLVAAASLFSVFTGDLQSVSALSPIVDGVLLSEQPIDRVRSGAVAKPVIVGSNHDEGVLFTSADVVLTRQNLEDHIAALIGDGPLVDSLMEVYDAESFFFPKDAWVALMGEATFICPGVELARAMAPHADVYAYHFTRVPPALLSVGATHGLELPYVFDTFSSLGLIPLPSDDAVRAEMQKTWGLFAWTGAPGFEQGFSPYTLAQPAFIVFDDPTTTVSDIRDGRCAELKALGVVY